nr:MAG TPA: hypothetical protein [Caudoviricetes sp.]
MGGIGIKAKVWGEFLSSNELLTEDMAYSLQYNARC